MNKTKYNIKDGKDLNYKIDNKVKFHLDFELLIDSHKIKNIKAMSLLIETKEFRGKIL